MSDKKNHPNLVLPFPLLTFENAALSFVKKGETLFVWCAVRKKKLVLTPEEWVRQHAIHFLIHAKKIPIGLIAVEMRIKANQLARRCDIVVFGQDGAPRLIVECKAPEIPLTEKTFRQIAQYNSTLNVDYLMLTNGLEHVHCKIDRENKTLNYLEELPSFEELA